MRHLSAWRAFARKMKQYNTGLLLITDNSDENAITFSLKSLRFSFPFIIDKGKKFKSKNSSVIGIAQDNTFVINKTENVIFTSSPIENEERWNTFVRLIKH
jgi:hypothetical protein